MDPNETLFMARLAAERIQSSVDDCLPIEDEDSLQLADTFQALDQWIKKGGFLPDTWKT